MHRAAVAAGGHEFCSRVVKCNTRDIQICTRGTTAVCQVRASRGAARSVLVVVVVVVVVITTTAAAAAPIAADGDNCDGDRGGCCVA